MAPGGQTISQRLHQMQRFSSDKQINRIMEARAEYETGNTLTESSANAEIEEWIKK